MEAFGIEAVPVPLNPPQIQHGLVGIEPSVSAVRGRRLTARVMARNLMPVKLIFIVYKKTHCGSIRKTCAENALVVV